MTRELDCVPVRPVFSRAPAERTFRDDLVPPHPRPHIPWDGNWQGAQRCLRTGRDPGTHIHMEGHSGVRVENVRVPARRQHEEVPDHAAAAGSGRDSHVWLGWLGLVVYVRCVPNVRWLVTSYSFPTILLLLLGLQAHAVTGHKAQGQTLPQIVLARLHRKAKQGGLVSLLRALGWFYTAASRTKTRAGLWLQIDELPVDHIQARRYDVLAEMARLQVLHEETRTRLHGMPATATDQQRLQQAQAGFAEAQRRFRRSKKK